MTCLKVTISAISSYLVERVSTSLSVLFYAGMNLVPLSWVLELERGALVYFSISIMRSLTTDLAIKFWRYS